MSAETQREAAPATEEDVRAVLEEALGDPRLGGVGADTPLLRSGVITSIELVSVLVDVEKRFGVTIPQNAAPQLSIAGILRAVGGEAPVGAIDAGPPAGTWLAALGRASRRPAILLVAAIATFFAIDLTVRALVEGPLAGEYRAFTEEGRRLYAWSGAFSQDSFQLALRHHAITAAPPKTDGELRVAVFGDSGTIGSFVSAADAIPAAVEDSLRATGTRARVFNLAWYGRLLTKDLMLLEAIWDRPIDVVVFTISEDHIRRSMSTTWVERYRHISFNASLLASFLERLPPDEQAPFREILARLRRADLRQQGPLRRFEHEHLALVAYQPFLRWLATVRFLPARFQSAMRADMTTVGQRRCALEDPPARLPPDLTEADLDRAQIDMLRSAIRLLQKRGVRTVLYVEPFGPREVRPAQSPALTAASVIAELARETGSTFVDQTWALGRPDFIDTLNHFTPDANRRIGEAIARAIGGTR